MRKRMCFRYLSIILTVVLMMNTGFTSYAGVVEEESKQEVAKQEEPKKEEAEQEEPKKEEAEQEEPKKEEAEKEEPKKEEAEQEEPKKEDAEQEEPKQEEAEKEEPKKEDAEQEEPKQEEAEKEDAEKEEPKKEETEQQSSKDISEKTARGMEQIGNKDDKKDDKDDSKDDKKDDKDDDNEEDVKDLDHIDVYVAGYVTVNTQLNGVTVSTKSGKLAISNISATLTEDGNTTTYTNFTLRPQSGTNNEQEYHKDVPNYSRSAVIVVSGKMVNTDLGIDATFTKTISGDSLLAAVEECWVHTGCDIRITESEVLNTITHDVTFKTETGGKIGTDTANMGTTDIKYTDIIDGSSFPSVPKTDPDSKYEFIGWFDEDGNQIDEFPKTVDKDYVFIAKWRTVEAEYTVEHYLQDGYGKDTYTIKADDTETISAKLGSEAKAEPNDYDKYEFNETKSTTTGTVEEGLVLKLYYDLKVAEPSEVTPVAAVYLVKHYKQNLGGGYDEVTEDAERNIGKIDEPVKASPKSYEGYTYNADESTASGKVIMPELVDEELNILVLKLYYDLNEVEYKVEHYLQDGYGKDTYTIKAEDTKTISAKLGSEAKAELNDYDKYEFNETKSTTTGTVEEGLVLKLYYDLKVAEPSEVTPVAAVYLVKHYKQNLGGGYDEVTEDAERNIGKIDEIVKASPKSYEGYTYNADESTASGKVIMPELVNDELNILVLKLYYDLNEVEYKVEHYLQDESGEDSYTLDDTEDFKVKPGKDVSADVREYDKYELNEEKSILTGTAEDGLVLKIYYDLKEVEEKDNDNDNSETTKPVKEDNNKKTSGPKTGDNNFVEFYLTMMFIGLFGIIAILGTNRKRRVR